MIATTSTISVLRTGLGEQQERAAEHDADEHGLLQVPTRRAGRSNPGFPTDRRVPAWRGSLEMARVAGCDASAGSGPTSSNSKNSSGSGRFGSSAPTRVSSSASREKSLNSSRSDCGALAPPPWLRRRERRPRVEVVFALVGRRQHLRHLAGGGLGPVRQVVLAGRADRIGRQDRRPFDVGRVGRARQREPDRGTGAVVGRPLGAVAVAGRVLRQPARDVFAFDGLLRFFGADDPHSFGRLVRAACRGETAPRPWTGLL